MISSMYFAGLSHTFLYLIIPPHFCSQCFEGFCIPFLYNLPLVLCKPLFLLEARTLLCNTATAFSIATICSGTKVWVWFCIRIIYFVSFTAALFLMFASLSFDHYDIIAICGSSVDVLVTYLTILLLTYYPYLFFTVLAFTSHSYSCQTLLGLLFINFLVPILFI